MESLSVQSVRWRDYSKDAFGGDVFTLSVNSSKYLLTALAVFITLVGNSVWSIISFTHHQLRARNNAAKDGLFWQIQVLLRHPSSPGVALRDAFLLWWAWRGNEKRVKSLKRRLFIVMIPPMLVFVAFVVAGIFVSDVAHEAYKTNNVLLKSTKCGQWSFDISTTAGKAGAQQKNAKDTRNARSYVQNCYNGASSSSICSLYSTKDIAVQTDDVSCPFGTNPSGNSLCLYQDGKAVRFDTGLLDSNAIFGINTDRTNSIMVRKVATCSPIQTASYVNISVSDGSEYAVWNFELGSLGGIQGATYQYNTYKQQADIGYTLYSVYTVNNFWKPIEELNIPNADVSAHFLAQNSMLYPEAVDDIWFAAHQVYGQPQTPFYGADQPTNVLVCAEQYQLHNPVTNTSSSLSTIMDLVAHHTSLGFNPFQLVTARNFILDLDLSSIFNTVTNLGPSSLLASDSVIELRGITLPDDQWQREAKGWFQTSLARIQWMVLDWATNTADLGADGHIEQPDRSSSYPEDQAAVSLCSSLRVRNVGGYQTFSFPGVIIVVVVGLIIMIVSFSLEQIVEYIRQRRSSESWAEVARVHDSKFQLLRRNLAVSSGLDTFSRHLDVWERVQNIIPVAKPETLFHMPESNRIDMQKVSPTWSAAAQSENSDWTKMNLLRSS